MALKLKSSRNLEHDEIMREKIIEEITEIYCEIHKLPKYSKNSLKSHLQLFPIDYLERRLRGLRLKK